MIDQINALASNKIPKDRRGDEIKRLEYTIDDKNVLISLIDALITNNQFKGEIIIHSGHFDDLIGYKIVNIIQNNNLTVLIIGNRNKPFSDRITSAIGDALLVNSSLRIFEAFMDVNELATFNIIQFLTNSNSSLESMKYLKITNNILSNFEKYFNKSSKLKSLGFYYKPLVIPDLLYSNNILI
jgi:hypothetical protein